MALLPRIGERTAHLVLVGDGSEREPLAALAETLGLTGRVHFAGERRGSLNFHHLFDVSALSSLHEGFPNSLIEAMAAGRPVVATSVGGVTDAVEHGVTGYLVAARDPSALAMALSTLLGQPALRRAFGDAGRERVRSAYGADDVIERLQALYLSLVTTRSAARSGRRA